jgi:hypothetical protein
MSEIPFVNRLGDAIDEVIAAPQPAARLPRRRRARRYVQIALAALLVAGGTMAVAQVLSDPDELATASVACYGAAYPNGGGVVDWAGTRSPVEVCAHALEVDGESLVACDAGGTVAVLRRSGPRTCTAAGLSRLPAGYSAARGKVAALERKLLALQTSAECIPPEELARRAQALLDRLGWSGWRTNLRRDVYDGPCGAIMQMGGTPRLTLAGALDYPGRELMVTDGLPRSLASLLYGTPSKPGVAAWLVDLSGRRCYTEAGLRSYVERKLSSTGRRIGFRTASLRADVGLSGPRGRRYREGCAVIDVIGPAADFEGLVVRILRDPSRG